MHVDLIIERFSTNKLGKADEQRKEIAQAADKRASTPGVIGKASKLEGPTAVKSKSGSDQYYYTFKVRVEKEKFRSEQAATKVLELAQKFVQKAAEARGWLVKGEVNEVAEQQMAVESRPPFVVPELTDEVQTLYFNHIKEREAHIRLMHASLKTYSITDKNERNHTLLFGEPAAAKSSLIKSFKAWLEEDGMERITMVNATTLSKAGLENWILDKAKDQMLPEILWINELEKGNQDDFLCLLNIMDDQAEIQRLNSRIGKQQAKCNILIWADCNDGEKIKNWNKGALWSRFNKRWPCVRPSRETMLIILKDMIKQRGANGYPANALWAKAAVDYAFDVLKTNDPREIKGLLDGGDGLLDGSYFKDMELVSLASKTASLSS